jgi:peroxiredoxin
MDKSFFSGLLRDWGIAGLVAVALFVGWKILLGGPISTGRIDHVELSDLSGRTLNLATFYQGDKPIVLNFWATWCGPCIREIPEFVAFKTNHPDLHVLGISVDEDKSLAALNAFVRRRNINYEILHDTTGAVARAFGVSTLPTTYVLHPDGTIAQVRVGVVTESTLDRMVGAAR